MTRALPFTKANLKRRIDAAREAKLYVLGMKSDGTLILGEKPIEAASVAPQDAQPSPPATRRMGDYFRGGSSETQGA
jgi:hypothetical protein